MSSRSALAVAVAALAVVLYLAVFRPREADPTPPAGVPIEDVRRLCIALDEAGSDSTDEVVLARCREAMR